MKRLAILTALALSAGLFVSTSPASAWTCTARNAGGTPFTVFGFVRESTEARAIMRCEVLTGATGTCVVVNCRP